MPVRKRLETAGALPPTPGFVNRASAFRSTLAGLARWKSRVSPPRGGYRCRFLREDGGGFPMGPLALTDLIGGRQAAVHLFGCLTPSGRTARYLPSLLQQELALAGRLGKKSEAFTASIAGPLRRVACRDAALPPVMRV